MRSDGSVAPGAGLGQRCCCVVYNRDNTAISTWDVLTGETVNSASCWPSWERRWGSGFNHDGKDLPTPHIRRQLHWSHFIFKCIHFDYPSYLKQPLVPFSSTHLLRHTVQLFFFIPVVSKSIGKKSFMFKAPSDWNNLPTNIHSISSFRLFKHALSNHFHSSCVCRL